MKSSGPRGENSTPIPKMGRALEAHFFHDSRKGVHALTHMPTVPRSMYLSHGIANWLAKFQIHFALQTEGSTYSAVHQGGDQNIVARRCSFETCLTYVDIFMRGNARHRNPD